MGRLFLVEVVAAPPGTTTTTHPLLGMDRRGRTHYLTVLQAVT
jgi:hypothetical protein